MHHPLLCCLILVGSRCLVSCLLPCVDPRSLLEAKLVMQVSSRHNSFGATQSAYDVVTCTSALFLVLSVNAFDDSTDCSIEEGCFDMALQPAVLPHSVLVSCTGGACLRKTILFQQALCIQYTCTAQFVDQATTRTARRCLQAGAYSGYGNEGKSNWIGSTSTRLSDRPGTLSAVVSFVFMPACCIYTVCSA